MHDPATPTDKHPEGGTMTDEIFDVAIEGRWTLDVTQVWPDRDAPENPTADDVIAVMRECTGSIENLIREWNLRPTLTVNGKYAKGIS